MVAVVDLIRQKQPSDRPWVHVLTKALVNDQEGAAGWMPASFYDNASMADTPTLPPLPGLAFVQT